MGLKRFISGSISKSKKQYEFNAIAKDYKIFSEKKFRDYLIKWSMDQSLKMCSYKVEGNNELQDVESIVVDMFKCESITNFLGYSVPLEHTIRSETTVAIETEEIPCTLTTTEIFDRLIERKIVLADGTIRKCLEEYAEDIIVADELRNMLLVEDSQNYDLYNENERDEFLFRIFTHLCVGGVLNQYEDNVEPYVLMSKILYKDVVSVRKSRQTQMKFIVSEVFKITCFENGEPTFPSNGKSPHDFFYLVLNHKNMTVTLMYHHW